MTNFPILRLELENMRHAMATALTAYQGEISNYVNHELKRVIAEFDFGRAVTEAAEQVMKESIAAYFRYGPGKDMARNAIESALNDIFAQAEAKGKST